jgi:hypothetical protein
MANLPNERRIHVGAETNTTFAKLMIGVAYTVNAIVGQLYLIILDLGAVLQRIRKPKPQSTMRGRISGNQASAERREHTTTV